MIQKILHIFLAILIVSSSSGLIINKHYCLDHLVSVALMAPAEKCQVMQDFGTTKENEGWQVWQHEDCCKDISSFLKVNQEQKAENLPIVLFELTDFQSLPLLGSLISEFSSKAFFSEKYYKPPLLVWDRPVRLQTFLC